MTLELARDATSRKRCVTGQGRCVVGRLVRPVEGCGMWIGPEPPRLEHRHDVVSAAR